MKRVGVKAVVAFTCAWLGVAVPATADTVEVLATGILTFDPPDVVITVGDSVHWTGLTGGFHTVAEADDALAMVWNGGFHSAAGASEFTFTFTAPGVFHYICEPHVAVGMRGTVTVNEVSVRPPLPENSLGIATCTLDSDCTAGVLCIHDLTMSVGNLVKSFD
ncbi:MAG: hypothetical protein IID42_13285, partial [Planctomycetes bacterium]|nr:hypothetical protein [Planctomycetota bacterium]